MMATTGPPGSSSIEQPEYWWYRARSDLLETALGGYLGDPGRVLDVGSADGPSVAWMQGSHRRVTVDVDPRGLAPGEGVRGSALALPFVDGRFDVVSAFDVVEHCDDEALALAELSRVLAPGGRLLLSVPAYQWAWTDHDVRAGHYRRYTEPRLAAAVANAGLRIRRTTYGFCAVFGFFVAERVLRRLRRRRDRRGADSADAANTADTADTALPSVPPALDRVLMGLCRLDQRVLRSRDLPFGSSVFLAAEKPG